jgi:glycosyltransferase involved in cell wall biosynthesis
MKIFVIIPAYNEEKHIAHVVDDVKQYVDTVVVVDDASTDHTADRAMSHGAIVLQHITNRDQGAALQTGNEYAMQHEADVIVHFDADGQHQAKDIPRLAEPIIRGEVDVVFGSRFLSGAVNHMPKTKRYVLFPIARWVNHMFTNMQLSDPQTGLRALSIQACQRVIITQDHKAHCSEITSLVAKAHLRYVEVPVDVLYHEYGQNFTSGVKIFWDLLKAQLMK